MKKVLVTLTAFVFVGLVACGPSAEQKKAMEENAQKAADSTANTLLQKASTAATTDSSAKTNTAAPADTTKK